MIPKIPDDTSVIERRFTAHIFFGSINTFKGEIEDFAWRNKIKYNIEKARSRLFVSDFRVQMWIPDHPDAHKSYEDFLNKLLNRGNDV